VQAHIRSLAGSVGVQAHIQSLAGSVGVQTHIRSLAGSVGVQPHTQSLTRSFRIHMYQCVCSLRITTYRAINKVSQGIFTYKHTTRVHLTDIEKCVNYTPHKAVGHIFYIGYQFKGNLAGNHLPL
jgi:hypothetical protein